MRGTCVKIFLWDDFYRKRKQTARPCIKAKACPAAIEATGNPDEASETRTAFEDKPQGPLLRHATDLGPCDSGSSHKKK